MVIEIRPCRDDAELKALDGVASYVFANNQPEDPPPDVLRPEWTRAAFDDGKLVTSYAAYPFTVRLNGRPVQIAGVTAVGTLPTHRRRGLLRRIMVDDHARMKEEGQPFAMLWASMGAIYQRFGYGLGSTATNYRVDPQRAAFAFEQPITGSLELLDGEAALETAKPLYREYSAPRNLWVHRAPAMWQRSVFRPENKGEPVYFALYKDAAGRPRGYVVYQTRDVEQPGPGPFQRLTIRDWVALDSQAYRGL